MAELGRSAWGLVMFLRAAIMASRTEALDWARLVVEARRVAEFAGTEGALGLWESFSRAVWALASRVVMIAFAFSGQVLAKDQ